MTDCAAQRIDAFELEVFDHTGDIDLATQVGECTRRAVQTACDALAQVVGLPPEAFVAGVLDYCDIGVPGSGKQQ